MKTLVHIILSSALLACLGFGQAVVPPNTFLISSVSPATSNSTSSAITNDNTTNATMYPVWVSGTSGNQTLEVSSTQLNFNPSSGNLTVAGSYTGAVSGALTLGASTALVGGAGNMAITAGTGNSRTLSLKTTTSGGTATNALVLDATQNATLTGNLTFGTSGSILNGTTGSIGLTATGTNQSITLTPSGSGFVDVVSNKFRFAGGNYDFNTSGSTLILENSGTGTQFQITSAGVATFNNHLLLGGLTTDGTGVLQFPAATTTAGGIHFGTDTAYVYRSGANQMQIDANTIILNGTVYSGGAHFFSQGTGAANNVEFGVGNLATSGMYYPGTNGLAFSTNSTTALTLDSSQNAQFAKLITSYNGITTAGNGVVTVQGAGRQTAQTGADASVATYTVGAADASFEVSANVNVTTATAHNFTATCTYTDEGNTSRTLTLSFSQLAGTIINNITNVTGAGPYEGIVAHIRCKASTSITIATTGTFTTVTYNVEGVIRKLQ